MSAGIVNALLLVDTVMVATASIAATTWRMKAPANLLWKQFWNATQMLSDPKFKLELR